MNNSYCEHKTFIHANTQVWGKLNRHTQNLVICKKSTFFCSILVKLWKNDHLMTWLISPNFMRILQKCQSAPMCFFFQLTFFLIWITKFFVTKPTFILLGSLRRVVTAHFPENNWKKYKYSFCNNKLAYLIFS